MDRLKSKFKNQKSKVESVAKALKMTNRVVRESLRGVRRRRTTKQSKDAKSAKPSYRGIAALPSVARNDTMWILQRSQVKTQKSKLKKLSRILIKLERLLVAFSGGVDSTFLIKAARDVLGARNVLAVTATSETYPRSELKDAKRLANIIGVKHAIIKTEEFKDTKFTANPPRRCYYCKSELFDKLKKIARMNGFKYIADASNYDDRKDFRPGGLAAKEKGIISPLKEARLTKEDIRRFSKQLGLPTWNKPSYACLASRIPYYEEITKRKLSAVESAEEFLRKKTAVGQIRVRCHGDIARIEVEPKDINKLTKDKARIEIVKRFTALGFRYVTVDLRGYRTGSMNWDKLIKGLIYDNI